jgi:hypothetical protein
MINSALFVSQTELSSKQLKCSKVAIQCKAVEAHISYRTEAEYGMHQQS